MLRLLKVQASKTGRYMVGRGFRMKIIPPKGRCSTALVKFVISCYSQSSKEFLQGKDPRTKDMLNTFIRNAFLGIFTHNMLIIFVYTHKIVDNIAWKKVRKEVSVERGERQSKLS